MRFGTHFIVVGARETQTRNLYLVIMLRPIYMSTRMCKQKDGKPQEDLYIYMNEYMYVYNTITYVYIYAYIYNM